MNISKDAKVAGFLKDLTKKAIDTGAPVFLRDLNDQLRKETIEDIKADKPDLYKVYQETDEDVVVGYYIDSKDYMLWKE